jgi:hypothetical protein
MLDPRRNPDPHDSSLALAAGIWRSAAFGREELVIAPFPTALRSKAFLYQFGTPGSIVYESPAVQVTSHNHRPMHGVLVRFQASSGSVEHSRVRTDADGVARAGLWKLRKTSGEDIVTATVGHLQQHFHARARIPVELARYQLETIEGRGLPVSWGQQRTIDGSISFYTDNTFAYRWKSQADDGRIQEGEIPGLYARTAGMVRLVKGAPFDTPFVGTISGAALSMVYRSWVKWPQETYRKVTSVESWP